MKLLSIASLVISFTLISPAFGSPCGGLFSGEKANHTNLENVSILGTPIDRLLREIATRVDQAIQGKAGAPSLFRNRNIKLLQSLTAAIQEIRSSKIARSEVLNDLTQASGEDVKVYQELLEELDQKILKDTRTIQRTLREIHFGNPRSVVIEISDRSNKPFVNHHNFTEKLYSFYKSLIENQPGWKITELNRTLDSGNNLIHLTFKVTAPDAFALLSRERGTHNMVDYNHHGKTITGHLHVQTFLDQNGTETQSPVMRELFELTDSQTSE